MVIEAGAAQQVGRDVTSSVEGTAKITRALIEALFKPLGNNENDNEEGPDNKNGIEIKVGEDTRYKGVIGEEPEINKLSPHEVKLLESALNIPVNEQSNEGSQQQEEMVKGAIGVKIGERQVYRYARGTVAVNEVKQQRQSVLVPQVVERTSENSTPQADRIANLISAPEKIRQVNERRLEDASQLLSESQEPSPGEPSSKIREHVLRLTQVGDLRFKAQDYQGALEAFDEASSFFHRDSSNPDFLADYDNTLDLRRGEAHKALGNFQEASKSFDKAIQLGLRSGSQELQAGGHLGRSRVFLKECDRAAARYHLDESLKLSTGISTDLGRDIKREALRDSAKLNLMQGQTQKALAELDEAVKVCGPHDYQAFVERGRVHTSSGNTQNAKADFQMADQLKVQSIAYQLGVNGTVLKSMVERVEQVELPNLGQSQSNKQPEKAERVQSVPVFVILQNNIAGDLKEGTFKKFVSIIGKQVSAGLGTTQQALKTGLSKLNQSYAVNQDLKGEKQAATIAKTATKLLDTYRGKGRDRYFDMRKSGYQIAESGNDLKITAKDGREVLSRSGNKITHNLTPPDIRNFGTVSKHLEQEAQSKVSIGGR